MTAASESCQGWSCAIHCRSSVYGSELGVGSDLCSEFAPDGRRTDQAWDGPTGAEGGSAIQWACFDLTLKSHSSAVRQPAAFLDGLLG
jgi:hypothetical protein